MTTRRLPSSFMMVLLLAFTVGARPAVAFHVNTHSAIILDAADGKVLFQQDADTPIPPASITKILTLYLVYDAIRQGKVRPDEMVRVSNRAAGTGGSRMFIKAGKRVPLRELMKGMAVFSGNDACVAVAEHLSGNVENFVDKMNRTAKALGMNSSHFVNPHGLPGRGQITTARDIAVLCRAYLRRFPESLKIHSIRSYTYNHITQRNRNRLLGKCPGVDGLKTGYVAAAGYNLAVTARRGNKRVIAVVMGAENPRVRATEATLLVEQGFQRAAQLPSKVVDTKKSRKPGDRKQKASGVKVQANAKHGKSG